MACVCGARCALADMTRCVVGADVLGGPRPRGRLRCRPVGAARRGRRALPGARMACVCGHGAECGRGRRPGGPRTCGRLRCRPVDVPWARRAEDVAPYHGCAHGVRVRTWRACADMARCVVGADVPGGPRARGVPDVVPWTFRGRGAPRTSRPTRCAHGVRVRRAVCVCGHGAVRGRGRRPRRPASPWASPMSSHGRPVGKSGWVQCGFVS